MFRLYLSYLMRDIGKNKLFFSFNLLGLSAGLVCFTCVILFVSYETSYDEYHRNANRISRITTRIVAGGTETKTALANGFLAEMLAVEFPQVELAVRFKIIEEKLNV
ncbi:MAG: ABC transporter permease, partial [Flammeovirgaceae bacterium]